MQPDLVTCVLCGRARPSSQRLCKCGEQNRVEYSARGAFYDFLAGVHADTDRRDRVYRMRRCSKLILKREPDNEYDPNAIRVTDSKRTMLGYVTKETAAWLAPAIDSGEEWHAEVARVVGTEPKHALMVMFIHEPELTMPPRDAWYTPAGQAEPAFFTLARRRNQELKHIESRAVGCGSMLAVVVVLMGVLAFTACR